MEKLKSFIKIFFRKVFINNFKLKVLSLIVSFLLWLNISVKEVVRVDTLKQIKVKNLPEGYVVKRIEPNFAKVILEGQRIYINSMDYIDLDVYIDCSNVKEGENKLPVKIENPLNNINIVSVIPEKVRVFVEKVKREVLKKQRK